MNRIMNVQNTVAYYYFSLKCLFWLPTVTTFLYKFELKIVINNFIIYNFKKKTIVEKEYIL